ncbi:hypothetical protein MMC18_001424, partial [Xylographa bjoerkii]|nr:hypothetical protein [Xylographa bjoerkii]
MDPAEAAVVTLGSLQAGQTETIIAEKAVLRVNVRTPTTATRKKVLASVRRFVDAECKASGCPKEPLIEESTSFPLIVNDESVARRLSESFSSHFKDNLITNFPGVNASEDVSMLAFSVDKWCCFWFFGGIDDAKWDELAKEGRLHQDILSNHSAHFASLIHLTLRVGMGALCV